MKKIAFCLVTMAIVSSAGLAHAFPYNFNWHAPAWGPVASVRPGADGIYGTGGRSDFGIKCSHCHIEPESRIGIVVNSVPAFGSAGGDMTYAPGTNYQITIQMTGEHLPGDEWGNLNGMAAAFENASGTPVGRLQADSGEDSNNCQPAPRYRVDDDAPRGVTTLLHGDCHAILGHARYDLTSWTFQWTAPTGEGDITVFMGVVDGDTAGESSLDDDVAERTLRLVPE